MFLVGGAASLALFNPGFAGREGTIFPTEQARTRARKCYVHDIT